MRLRVLAALGFLLVSPAALAKECVVLLHGLSRTESSFLLMEETLTAFGYTVVNSTYPSTRMPVEDLVAHIDGAVAECGDAEQIHFVTHSMGGILLRALAGRQPAGESRPHRHARPAQPRVGAGRHFRPPAALRVLHRPGRPAARQRRRTASPTSSAPPISRSASSPARAPLSPSSPASSRAPMTGWSRSRAPGSKACATTSCCRSPTPS